MLQRFVKMHVHKVHNLQMKSTSSEIRQAHFTELNMLDAVLVLYHAHRLSK